MIDVQLVDDSEDERGVESDKEFSDKDNDDLLIINDIKIDPVMFEALPLQRCDLSQCHAACCNGGVWLDEGEAPRILQYADEIKKVLPRSRHDESKWISDPVPDEDMPSGTCVGTNVVDDPLLSGETCCVFLTEDRLCALQLTSQKLSLGWPGIKPYYCALYPLWTDGDNLTRDDETPELLGDHICQRASTVKRPLYQVFREEAILVLGEDGYQELHEQAQSNQ